MSATAIPLAAPGLLGAQEAAAIREAIDRVVTSGVFVGGPEVTLFEEAFAQSLGTGLTCVGVGSGLDALVLALASLDLPDGGLVLVPANDGGYAALAAQSVGLRPVCLDVDEEGLVSLRSIQRRSEPGVVAVIATHLHGLAVDLGQIAAWCHERSIALVEDCSQAHGADGIARYADVSAFSFYPTKNLGALGDAGAVVTRHAHVAERVRSLGQYGWGTRFVVSRPHGRTSRLDALQAAVLRARLPYVPRAAARRREIVALYRKAAPALRFLARDDGTFVAHHAVVVDERRDRLARRCAVARIATAVHYPVLVADMPGLTVHGRADAPVAARLRDRMLSLPCFPGMTAEQVDEVCAVLTGWAVGRD